MSPRHPGFSGMFQPGKLTLGVFFPIEAFEGPHPTMANQVALARRASELGFAALWFRDVPLLDPRFGDAGQIYDPWTYLGFIAARTRDIALATGSIVLPLRHPLHVAKAAASRAALTARATLSAGARLPAPRCGVVFLPGLLLTVGWPGYFILPS